MEDTLKTTTYFKTPEIKNQILTRYESILENWQQPNQTYSLATRQGQTFVIETGNKNNPPLILLHSSGSSSYMWASEIEVYAQHFRVLAIDIPGEIGKSEEYRASWDNEDFIEWMEDIYKELNLQQAIITGISLGGWIAMKWASIFPHKVIKLIVMCPVGITSFRVSFFIRALFLSFQGSKGQKKMAQLMFNSKDIHPEVFSYFQLIADGFIYRRGAPPLLTKESMEKLSMPLLFLGGDKDVMINNEKSAHRLKQIIPKATIKIKKNMGHAVFGVSKEIVEFIVN